MAIQLSEAIGEYQYGFHKGKIYQWLYFYYSTNHGKILWIR